MGASGKDFYDNKKQEMNALIANQINSILFNKDGDDAFEVYLSQSKQLWNLSLSNKILATWTFGTGNFHEVSSKTRWDSLAKSQGAEGVEKKKKNGDTYTIYAEPCVNVSEGAYLFRPHFYYVNVTDNDGNPVLDENGKPKKQQVRSKWFRVYTAYSEQQMVYAKTKEPIKLPDMFDGIDAPGSSRILDAIKDFCNHNEIQYNEEKIAFGAKGYSEGGKVVLEEDDTDSAKLHTVFHEVTHEFLHQNDENKNLPRALKEGEAETCAAILMKYFGYDTSNLSAAYVRHWMLQNNVSPEKATEALKNSMYRIYDFTSKLISYVEKHIDHNIEGIK